MFALTLASTGSSGTKVSAMSPEKCASELAERKMRMKMPRKSSTV